MHEMSVNYANLMEENKMLKSENKKYKSAAMGKKAVHFDKSRDMVEILGSLD